MNNPLKYTDPSGYFWNKAKRAWKKVRDAVKRTVKKVAKAVKKVVKKIAEHKVLGTVAALAAAFYGGPALANLLGFTGKVAIGAAGGFLGGYVGSGGNLKAALIGGVTGAAAGYIGKAGKFFGAEGALTAERVIGHGVVGGVASVAQGGKFGSGFLSSAFTKVVSNPIKQFANGFSAGSELIGAAGAAIVGGTASVLGGGKFANGAQTAAIQYLFNHVSEDRSCSGRPCINRPKATRAQNAAVMRNIEEGAGLVGDVATGVAVGCASFGLFPCAGVAATVGLAAAGVETGAALYVESGDLVKSTDHLVVDAVTLGSGLAVDKALGKFHIPKNIRKEARQLTEAHVSATATAVEKKLEK